ncbi:MAG: hypothetical protein ACFB22_03805 [Rhodothalassiaceae bacterium]
MIQGALGPLVCCLACCLALVACSSGAAAPGRAEPSVAAARAEPAAPTAIEERLGALPRQTLEEGQCALFLFSGHRRRLVLVVDSDAAVARVRLDGRERRLPRTGVSGEPLFGQFTEQEFTGENLQLRLLVKPDQATTVVSGAVIREGRLTLEEPSGWRYVTPVAGAIACERG